MIKCRGYICVKEYCSFYGESDFFMTEDFYRIIKREGGLYVRKESKFGLYDEVQIYT